MRGSLAVGFLIYAVFTACAGHSASGAQPLPALGSLSHVAKICASHLLPGAPVKTVTVGGARRAGEAPPLRSPNKLLKWASPLVGRCLDTCGTGQHCGTGEQAIRDASSASVARSDLPSSDSPVASGQGESSASASRRWLAQAQPAAPNLVELTCDRDEVVPGERVLVRGREEHVFTVPPEAKPGQRIWQKFEGQWIDFTVVPLAEVLTAMDDTTLVLTLTSNMGESATLTVSVMGHSVSLRADPKKPVTARIDLGAPERPTAMVLPIEVSAGTSKMVIERGVIVDYGPRKVVDVPQRWQGGMRLRGQPETFDFGQTGAHVRAGEQSCGGDRRKAITMHPPYVGGVGYAFARLDPIRLPPKPKAVFRALVGKGDGSDPGDGILYRVAVIDESGQETVLAEKTVAQHKWELIEADLSRFAGKEVQLKLISDVGPNDNSIGDWACWADLRIETPGTELTYTLLDDPYALRREPGPHMIQGVTEEQLRTARRGWLHYDGMGLSGNIPPYQTYAELNGVPIGMLAPAGGDEVHGKWAEDVRLELPREAIAALRPLNQLVIHNPQRDYFKVRRFWIELELQDGRKCSSYISDVTFTQPPEWPYAEGILVPFSRAITVYISF